MYFKSLRVLERRLNILSGRSPIRLGSILTCSRSARASSSVAVGVCTSWVPPTATRTCLWAASVANWTERPPRSGPPTRRPPPRAAAARSRRSQPAPRSVSAACRPSLRTWAPAPTPSSTRRRCSSRPSCVSTTWALGAQRLPPTRSSCSSRGSRRIRTRTRPAAAPNARRRSHWRSSSSRTQTKTRSSCTCARIWLVACVLCVPGSGQTLRISCSSTRAASRCSRVRSRTASCRRASGPAISSTRCRPPRCSPGRSGARAPHPHRTPAPATPKTRPPASPTARRSSRRLRRPLCDPLYVTSSRRTSQYSFHALSISTSITLIHVYIQRKVYCIYTDIVQ